MQDCRGTTQKNTIVVCPKNGSVCKPVQRITVDALIKPEHKRALTSAPYAFCDSPDCDVVYVSAAGDHLITKNQVRVRVGIKASEDPIPLCYCFGFDNKAISDDIRSKGTTEIPKVITARVKNGECRCELTNPSGGCCLGDVFRAVNQAQALKRRTSA
jgi:hypothetical protein